MHCDIDPVASGRDVRVLQGAAYFPGEETASSGSGAGQGGAPRGMGAAVALFASASLFALAAGYGIRWSLKVWPIAAAIFYSVYLLIFSNFLAGLDEFHSGIRQTLGYWLDQQTDSAGDQPWFYYILIALVYEYLPLALGAIATVFYFRRRDSFAFFLVFWSWAAFLAYSLSAEKYPWLLVNIALPLILLSGKFLGDIIKFYGFQHPASIGLLAMAALLFALTAEQLTSLVSGRRYSR